MQTPMAKEIVIPTRQVRAARSHWPAPTFARAHGEMELSMAMAGMMAKLLNLLTTPTAAEASTPPTVLTSAVMNRTKSRATL